MVLLSNETFLNDLNNLIQKANGSKNGSLYLTTKKYDGRTCPKLKDNCKPTNNLVLIRAVFNKIKISTVCEVKDVNKFQMVYLNNLKCMYNTKKTISNMKD
ncbi:hypothetical protein A3Q56_00803 [Intoshia linei]|uniref:Signal recognition particle 14 kDa protein n=1 Tax=Intoshia linei TaxID=1819745 RepID=A0A177BB52_9BILA|nr:hypothetical protein A3Q56_00803 [Intoshia linei]